MDVQPLNRISSSSQPSCYAELVAAQEPVVIEGGARHWPAFERWTAEYLAEQAGALPVECMEAPSDLPVGVFSLGRWRSSEKLGRRNVSVPFREYLAETWESDRPRLYLRSDSAELLERLGADVPWLDWPGARRPLDRTIWIGARKTIAVPHYDLASTFHALIRGRKRFLLFPPSAWWRLYPHGIFSGYYPHTSRILDLNQVDTDRYRRLRNAAAFECELEAGDIVFIPVAWWHQVDTLEPSIAVSQSWKHRYRKSHPLVVRRRMFTAYQGALGRWRALKRRIA